MQQIYHKKNELFEVEFYEDKECTQAFDFTNVKDLYIELRDGDLLPLLYLTNKFSLNGRTGPRGRKLFVPYLPQDYDILHSLNKALYLQYEIIYHIGGYSLLKPITPITPDLSKYIPEDNAVLFLSEDVCDKYERSFCNIARFSITENDDGFYKRCSESGNRIYYKKLTLFLPHGTKSELQKAEEVAKELIEKYGVEEVNLFALHFFQKEFYTKPLYENELKKLVVFNEIYNNPSLITFKTIDEQMQDLKKNSTFINKIITTSSTGILKPKDDNERLQVIDCKEMFEEYLKENNLL